MTTLNQMSCCGMRELGNVQAYWPMVKDGKEVPNTRKHDIPPKAVIEFICGQYGHSQPGYKETPFGQWAYRLPKFEAVRVNQAHIVFTDANEATRPRYGKELSDYISEHKLGNVIQTETRHNNNYRGQKGHDITCYVWSPDENALTEYVKKEFPALLNDDTWSDTLQKEYQGWIAGQWAINVYHHGRRNNCTKFDPKKYGFPTDLPAMLKQFDAAWHQQIGNNRNLYMTDEAFAQTYGYTAPETLLREKLEAAAEAKAKEKAKNQANLDKLRENRKPTRAVYPD